MKDNREYGSAAVEPEDVYREPAAMGNEWKHELRSLWEGQVTYDFVSPAGLRPFYVTLDTTLCDADGIIQIITSALNQTEGETK